MAWTYTFDFKKSRGGWVDYYLNGQAGQWVAGQGWQHGWGQVSRISLNKAFSSATIVTSITFVLSEPLNGDWKALAGAIPSYDSPQWIEYHGGINVTEYTLSIPPNEQRSLSSIFIDVTSDVAINGAPINASLTSIILRGKGSMPAGISHDVGDCPFTHAGKKRVKTRRPISLQDGEKREEVTDIAVNTPGGPLAFTRAYRRNKQDAYQFMGMGWTHDHAISLDDTVANKLIVRLGNGGEAHFTVDPDNANKYIGDPGSVSEIIVNPASAPARYTVTAADKSTYIFDDQEKLRSRSWPSGESWTYNYDGSNRLTSVVDDAYDLGSGVKRQLQFSYISNPGQYNDGKLWRVGDHTAAGLSGGSPSGRYIEFAYTEERNNGTIVGTPPNVKALLASVRDLRGNLWTYTWYGQKLGENDADKVNRLIATGSPSVDMTGDGAPEGSITLQRLMYTLSAGTLTGIVQEKGIWAKNSPLETTTFDFQPQGQNITLEQTAGKITRHTFDGDLYVSATDPAGHANTQEWDVGSFRPALQQDARGNATQLAWSGDGKLLNGVTDALGNQTSFAYSVDDTLASATDAQGRKTEYTYGDLVNPRLPTRIRVFDSDGITLLRWQEFTYDSNGRTLSETTLNPADGSIIQQVQRTFGSSGSGNGLLESITQVDPRDPANDTTTTYSYDSMGRVIKTHQSSLLGTCQFNYTVYDNAGNVIATVCGPESVTPPATVAAAIALFDPRNSDKNRVTVHEYDTLGRRVKTTVNAGASFAQMILTAYDALGRVIRTIANYVTSPAVPAPYTASRRAFKQGANNDQNLLTDTAYNARGMVRRQIDVLGNVMLFGYDDAGRPIKTIQNASQPDYNNDDIGAAPDSALTRYQPSSAVDQDIITMQAYDAVGNGVKTTDPLGHVTLTGFDPLNRPVKVVRSASQPDYDFSADPTLSRYDPGYDPDQDLIETTEYDAMGRVIRTRRLLDNRPTAQWDTTLFGYDSLGRQVKVIRTASRPSYDLVSDPGLSRYPASSQPDQDIVTQATYDDDGRVMFTQDAGDVQTWFAYDGLGRQVKAIVNPLGTATDGGVRDPRSDYYHTVINIPDRDVIAQTAFDSDGRVLWTQDTLGRKTWSVYDNRGRLVKSVANATGTDINWGPHAPRNPAYLRSGSSDEDVIARTVYDGQGRVDTTIDLRGNQTRYRYDLLGRRIQTIANFVDGKYNTNFPHEDRIETMVYDLAGRVVRTIDPAGVETRFEYDALGRRLKTIANYVNGVFSSASPDEDLISVTRYNKAGQVIAATDVRGTQTAFTYDPAGRRLTVTQAVDTLLETSSYTCYDKAGRVVRAIQNWVSDPAQPSPDAKGVAGNWLFVPSTHGLNNDQNLVAEYAYDRASRRTTMTDPAGNSATTSYFKDGQVQSITDPMGMVTQFRYDGLRRRTRVVASHVSNGQDPAKWVWNSGWKASNGTTAINHGANSDQNVIVDVAYDKGGRMVSLRNPLGELTAYTYDKLDRRTSLTNPLGKKWETAYFNLADGGTRSTMTFPGINGGTPYPVQRDFDPLGRLLSMAYGDPAATPDVKFAYDAAGNRIRMSEYGSAGFTNRIRETLYNYDDVRRLTSVNFDANGDGGVEETVSYEYDAGGLRTKLTLPGSLTITYVYDEKGQLVNLKDWDGQATEFRYDLAGRLATNSRSSGLESRYEYDLAGRLRHLRHHERNKLLARFMYSVDGRGNRTQAFEQMARPATITTTIGKADGAVSYYAGSWTDSGLFKVTSDFWARMTIAFTGNEGRLAVGVGPDHGLFDIYIDGSLWQSFDGYAANTGERVINFYLDRGGAHTLDIRNRAEKNKTSTNFTLRFRQLEVVSTVYDEQTIEYAYDNLSHLTEARYNPGTNVDAADGDLLRRYLFTYDRAGNRLSESLAISGGAPTVTNYTYNAANQMTSNGSITFGYDNNGNLRTANGTPVMTWDRANRLLSATDGVTTSLYAYDGEGHRIQQTVGASVTKYLLDLQPGLPLVLAETLGANTKRFVHGPMGIHAQEDASGVWTWAVQDALGNVRLEASNAVAVNGMRNFAPYGVGFGQQGSFSTPYGFTGEPTDGNGLVHLRARYLSPALGIFASLDPFEGADEKPMSLNGYSWVEGNVPNMIDPSGAECTVQSDDTGSLIANLGDGWVSSFGDIPADCLLSNNGGNSSGTNQLFTNLTYANPVVNWQPVTYNWRNAYNWAIFANSGCCQNQWPSTGRVVTPFGQLPCTGNCTGDISVWPINPSTDEAVFSVDPRLELLRNQCLRGEMEACEELRILCELSGDENSDACQAYRGTYRGDCDAWTYGQLKETMEAACKSGLITSCTEGALKALRTRLRGPRGYARARDVILEPEDIQQLINNAKNCIDARQAIQDTCYSNSPDPNHTTEILRLIAARTFCEQVLEQAIAAGGI